MSNSNLPSTDPFDGDDLLDLEITDSDDVVGGAKGLRNSTRPTSTGSQPKGPAPRRVDPDYYGSEAHWAASAEQTAPALAAYLAAHRRPPSTPKTGVKTGRTRNQTKR